MILPRFAPKLFGAKTFMQWVWITLPDGTQRFTRFIGRGKFSNAFLHNPAEPIRHVYIYTKHGDLSKDILSHVDRKNNKHIPVMRYLGPMFDRTVDVYSSVFYETPVRRKTVTEKIWRTVMALRTAHAEACAKFTGDIIAKNQCIDFNYYIAENVQAPAKIKEALCLITESAQDWGKTYLFDDFGAKNLGLDREGRLVFIDAMFDAGLLQQERR